MWYFIFLTSNMGSQQGSPFPGSFILPTHQGTKHPAVPIMQQIMTCHYLLSSTKERESNYKGKLTKISQVQWWTCLKVVSESCLLYRFTRAANIMELVTWFSGGKSDPSIFNQQPSICTWFALWSKLALANPIKSTHWDPDSRWCSWLSMKQPFATHEQKMHEI